MLNGAPLLTKYVRLTPLVIGRQNDGLPDAELF